MTGLVWVELITVSVVTVDVLVSVNDEVVVVRGVV